MFKILADSYNNVIMQNYSLQHKFFQRVTQDLSTGRKNEEKSTSRVIVLVDMDCFYCQVEEKLKPELKGKPVAVVQYNAWQGGGIIAVNYPARAKGVTRHMRGDEARKICPEIELVRVPNVRGKADLTKYREAGKEVAEVLKKFSSLLERASVDEAYLDITESVERRIFHLTRKITCENLQNTFIVGSNVKDFLDNIYEDEHFNMSNLRLAIGGTIVEMLRAEVYQCTGYQCSAGIAHNKVLAKLACGLNKPNKQTILPHDSVAEFYQTLPVSKIRGLGGKFGDTLGRELKIKFMGELDRFSEKELIKRFDDKTGTWLYNLARGIDLEPVTTRLVPKSIGCCKKFPGKNALTTPEDIIHWLSELSGELAERLEKDQEENDRKARQMVVSIVQESDRKDISSSKTIVLHSYDAKKICDDAFEVIRKHAIKINDKYHIKLLGISTGNFESCKNVREITSYFKAATSSKDNLRDRTDKLEDGSVSYSLNEQSDLPEGESTSFANDNLYKPLRNEEQKHDFGKIQEWDCEIRKSPSAYSANTESDTSIDSKDLEFYDDSFLIKSDIEPNLDDMSDADSISNEIVCRRVFDYTVGKDDKESFFVRYLDDFEPEGPVERNFDTSKVLEDSEVDVESDEPLDDKSNVCDIMAPSTSSAVLSESFETCLECSKTIPKSELIAHLDYHYALKLDKVENDMCKQNSHITGSNHIPKGSKKRKQISDDNNILMSFIKKAGYNTYTETEECPECQKLVPKQEFSCHIDYHLAKKVHLEINLVQNKSVPIKNGNKANTKINKKKKHVSIKTKSVTSFFKPV